MALTGRALIASRCAKFFKDGDLVNLGIGLPTLIPQFLPADVHVILQAENGIIGAAPATEETMAAAMRRSEMAHNSIATYMRMLRTFYNWCNAEGFSTLAVPAFKEKETVKDTYTDAELALLLKPN